MIIAIESASSDHSLALASQDGVSFAADSWTGEGRQASELLPRLLVLLARAGRDLREATALAIGVGPGSFTGLRVSMSLAKGISLGLRVPVVGIPSLEAWLEAEPGAAAATARAGAQDVYLFTRGAREPRIVAASSLRGLVGASVLAAPSELAVAFDLSGTLAPREAAGAVARLAAARLRQDPRGDDLARLEPWYLRAPRGVAASETVSGWP
ncbi:MAG: tRNA (adenosine(37)-N6)-threonylcarbamoyltransferase complex dimerization subunit type 1 TsaB [Chloroflexi bacterium]|nr:tRNA (adenosine(37)-N6)-threonylcarbamoyltransferase complex dimerization subunit type 1 TsaB [Chloroflexota bacterium]